MGQATATPEYQERKKKQMLERKKIEEIAQKKNISVEQAAKDYEDVYKGRPLNLARKNLANIMLS